MGLFAKRDRKHLNEMIHDAALHSQLEDIVELANRIPTMELYFNRPEPGGESEAIPYDLIPVKGKRVLRFYTNGEDPRLMRKAMVPGLEVLRFIQEHEDLYGLVFYNHLDVYFGFQRSEIANILGRLAKNQSA